MHIKSNFSSFLAYFVVWLDKDEAAEVAAAAADQTDYSAFEWTVSSFSVWFWHRNIKRNLSRHKFDFMFMPRLPNCVYKSYKSLARSVSPFFAYLIIARPRSELKHYSYAALAVAHIIVKINYNNLLSRCHRGLGMESLWGMSAKWKSNQIASNVLTLKITFAYFLHNNQRSNGLWRQRNRWTQPHPIRCTANKNI